MTSQVLVAANERTVAFDIPAGNASAALKEFSAQSGVQLLVSSKDIRGITTSAVRGRYTPILALKQMLATTSLVAHEDRATGAIAIVLAPPASGKSEHSDASPRQTGKGTSAKTSAKSGRRLLPGPAAAKLDPGQTNQDDDIRLLSRDEVLTLDEFVITSKKTSGYRATNSITATGIGAAIGETPITINVVTQDLITDTRSDLINDILRYVPGVATSPTNESQPSIRGFQGTYSLRNGVFRRQNLTTWNVDRVEVIQGPSSIFYSNIRPGGVINYITTKPVLGKTFSEVDLSVGENKYHRAHGAFNIVAGENLAFRFVLGSIRDETHRTDFREKQEFVSVAALWNIAPNHQLIIEAGNEETSRENSWSHYITPLTHSRYWGNPAAIAAGQSLETFMSTHYPGVPLYDMFAPFAPRKDDLYGRITPVFTNTFQRTINQPLDVTYNAKLTDRLVLSIIGNYAYENNQGINPGLGDIYADGTFRAVNAELFINVRDSYNLNTKLTYRFEKFGIKHTLIAGNDNQWVTQRYPQVNGTMIQRGPVIPLLNPRTMSVDGQSSIDASPAPFNSIRKNLQYFNGNYIVDQLSMLRDTLYFVAGARYVTFEQEVSYSATALGADLPAPPPNALARKWTPQVGALYKLPGGISPFASYSESIIPQVQIDASGNTVHPIQGKGYDVGLKFNLLSGALAGTVNYFEIKQTNTAVPDAARNAANGLPPQATFGYYRYGNAQQVRGVQMDFSYALNRDTQIITGWNHFLQAENVAPQSSHLNVGMPLGYQPKHMISVWTKYHPSSGPLKGFIFGGGGRYNTPGSVGSDFNTASVRLPSFATFDALLGYRTTLQNRPLEIRLNAKNVFNKIYREGNGGSFNKARSVVLSVSTQF